MLYMVTFTINIPPMLAYIPYMDPMGIYTPINDLQQHTTIASYAARHLGFPHIDRPRCPVFMGNQAMFNDHSTVVLYAQLTS